MSDKVSLEFLKGHLWKAADILRGSLDASDYRQPVMTLLFLKRLNDRFEENIEVLIKKGKSEKEAKKEFHHDFYIPDDARWENLSGVRSKVGEAIDKICKLIEEKNPKLEGVLTNTKYADPRKYPDNELAELISHFNSPRLRNSDLEKEDIFGDAYEYLLEKFADATKKKGGEFFTPREVVQLLVNITHPKEGMKICDPTCGSGGMLIMSRKEVEKHKGNPRDLVLDGQESNYGNLAMCKMNMVLHGIVDFNITYGDTLANPQLVKGGKLITYDRVLANFPFSMDWDNKGAEKDPYNRFRFGVPPAKDKADFAFIQHMYAQLNDKGQAAIICSQGVLFRGSVEQKIREGLIAEDAIEAIIAIPEKLFFGTGIPACVLVLNKNKPKARKDKIIFIYGAKDYKEGKNRNTLREEDIKKIVKAFDDFKDIDRYCHVADLEELKENEYNLNVPRYVDISEPEEEIDIQATIDELKKLDKERDELELKVKQDLKALGFKI
ncbi:MAG: type I restriction-modification system subunit M [Nitrosopumilus sp.]|uniref:type I restriction-modification system subunit M n=1 Tax=Nitrosopumilus sp. TaxID=2024843 RepID=UPI00247C8C47|nr:type I restriction-modification system subunit M [Nitrosopumilus sp.]MCV0392107.1 type I restriction-modification system subunit M [Nitrosopumilus sp.]